MTAKMKKNTLSKFNGALPAKMLAALCVLNCVGAVTPPETLPWSENCTALDDRSTCENRDLRKVDKCLGPRGNQRKCNNLCSAKKKSLSAKCKEACCPPPSPSPPPPSPSSPPPSPSPPPPSPPPLPPSSPPPSPSPPSLPLSPPSSPPTSPPSGCTDRNTFADKASLQTAVMEYEFNASAATAKYGAIAGWCVSGVTDMSGLFVCTLNFNADISAWDTSRVTSMRAMFAVAAAFNQPLSWDTSRVTDMRSMFHNAFAFNQPLSWDTSSVTDMSHMFDGAGGGRLI